MKRLPIVLFSFVCCNIIFAQQHPAAFAKRADLLAVKESINKYPILQSSFNEIKQSVDKWIGKDIDVPFPKDPAGGYTHEKHKENYYLMFNAGVLYQITGDARYALLVKNLFLKYAILNPTLKNHPEATSSSPGRIFWQALNDANWLVYTGIAFDCIYDYLTTEEKQKIKNGAYKPIVDYMTGDLKLWFNLIHNHAVWACAGVGIVGVATDNEDYVNMALYGADKDNRAGFLAHLNGLFSPDGYYNEGPYYTRYAILPFYFFANALHNTKPGLAIFNYRNKILQKALHGALQQTNINGAFYSYNDALKDKTFVSSELVVAVDIAWQVYGADSSLLPVAKAQGNVILNGGGMDISKALATNKTANYYPYSPIEFTDGSDGKKGGVSVLRMGKDKQLTSLIYKYSSHGMSHGHFDKLNIQLYDYGNEILQDYGAARFIGIEQKWGGRYLPETKNYAQQTIAHNTVVVNETSHYDGKEVVSEQNWPTKIFGTIDGEKVQVVSALDDKAYKQVRLGRTIYMIQLPVSNKPIIVDLFKTTASTTQQYDLPFNYIGSVISTNYKYEPYTSSLTTLGTKNGYQYLWKEAEALIKQPMAQFTFLNEQSFYTISSLVKDSARVFFTRLGANDPNFNLRRESSYIIRTKASNLTQFNIIEIHGNYSSVSEVANGAYSAVSAIQLLQDDANYVVARVTVHGKELIVLQCNNNYVSNANHSISIEHKLFKWTGPYAVFYDNQKLQ